MCITGALGIPGSGRERTNTRNSFVSKTLLCLALLLPNGLNMMLTIPFNLKLPGGILYYSFLFINIFFSPGRRFHGFLYHIRRVWWNNHPFLQHWHLPDHLERPEVLLWWRRVLQWLLPRKGGYSRHHAYDGYRYVWDWNLGSDMHLFVETLLWTTTAGRVAKTQSLSRPSKVHFHLVWDFKVL